MLLLWITVLLINEIRTFNCHSDSNELIGVAQIFRHGQRAPVSFYANPKYADKSYWPVAMGQLTNQGKRQHHTLGQYTKHRYRHFLSKYYNNSEFYVETSNMDRTHMSAQANVAGIYPPKDFEIWTENLLWQPIPIHQSQKNVITVPDCYTYYLDSAKVALDESYLPKSETFFPVYAYVRKYVNLFFISPLTIYIIYDELYLEDLMGYDLPEWTKTIYPEPLKTIAGYCFTMLSYTDNQKKLATGFFLKTIIDDFEIIWTNQTKPKFHIYSGHDFNLAMILNTLGAYNNSTPNVASTLYFELRNRSGEPIINIWYKDGNKVQKIKTLDCPFDCPLSSFKEKLQPWLVDEATWNVLCESKTAYFKDQPEFFGNFLTDLINIVYTESIEFVKCLEDKEPGKIRKINKIINLLNVTKETISIEMEKEKELRENRNKKQGDQLNDVNTKK